MNLNEQLLSSGSPVHRESLYAQEDVDYEHTYLIDADDDLSDSDVNKATQPSGNALGTIGGVWVPCVLCIFGVILFLRLGWIVGQAGIWVTLALFLIGYMVVTFTTLSLSAVATNGSMGGGGCYYLISRALGPEFGGSIGLIFYCANVFGCVVYLLGFAEALEEAFDLTFEGTFKEWSMIVEGLMALVILTGVCYVGAEFYAKTSIFVFLIMFVSLSVTVVSLIFQKTEDNGGPAGFVGWSLDTFKSNSAPDYSTDDQGTQMDTFKIFSILFPAVTGIMAGANMSGDLKNPAESIPKGTLWALLHSSIVYVLFAIFLAFTMSREALQSFETGYTIMMTTNFLPLLFAFGLFAATLSSAMASIIGGSKVLQALARDDVLPLGFFKKGSVGKDEPRRATMLTFLIVAILMITKLNLNQMASFQTLFFLLSYGIVNLACLLQTVTGSSNFRPTFRYYSWHQSLFGVILCLGVMIALAPLQAVISLGLCFLLFFYIHQKAPVTTWGDISQAIIFHQVRKYLLRLDIRKEHLKFWRPQILCLASSPRVDYRLLHLANKIKKGGLLVLGNVVSDKMAPGDQDRDQDSSQDNHINSDSEEYVQQLRWAQESRKSAWDEFIDFADIKAFPEVCMAPSVRKGAQNIMMSSGLGAMRPNSVMMSFYDAHCNDAIASLQHVEKYEELLESLRGFPPAQEQRSVSAVEYVQIMRDVVSFGHHLFVTRNLEKLPWFLVDGSKPSKSFKQTNELVKPGKEAELTIDIWILPDMDVHTINLCLMFGYILHRCHGGWKKYCSLRCLSIVKYERQKEREYEQVANLLDQYRIPAKEIRVVSMSDVHDAPVPTSQGSASRMRVLNGIIRSQSDNTVTAFVPINRPPKDAAIQPDDLDAALEDYMSDLEALTQNLCPVVLCHSTGSEVMTTEV